MTHGLAPHIHLAVFDARVIALDLGADRYWQFGGSLARVLLALVRGEQSSDAVAVEKLVALNILAYGSEKRTVTLFPQPRASALEGRDAVCAMPLLATIRAVGATMIALRLAGLRRTLAHAAREQAIIAGDYGCDAVSALARGYNASRLRLPLRRICLPDSLALLRIFSGAHIRVSLVIGVKLDPFAAHCWLQRGDLVLNDMVHMVGEYRPIFVL